MKRSNYLKKCCCVAAVFLYSCASIKTANRQRTIDGLKYLGKLEIPYNLLFDSTVVGGLSGIDYDASTGLYYLISDDRSEKNPARFYKAHMMVTETGPRNVEFVSVRYLRQRDGSVYPSRVTNRYQTPDPEAIRYNPLKHQLVWSSEGERVVSAKDTVLVNPGIYTTDTNGFYRHEYRMPSSLHMQALPKGPRQNGVIEGLAFSGNYRYLYAGVEEPLYEDGPRADTMEQDNFTRIIKFEVKRKLPVAQYWYPLGKVVYSPVPATAFKVNGVDEILWIAKDQLLVMERSFSTGRLACSIRLYLADLQGASDIGKPATGNNDKPRLVSKKLLLNLDDLGIYTDNIEGITWGPRLPNGNGTLILVADNNFSEQQQSQVLVFELLEQK